MHSTTSISTTLVLEYAYYYPYYSESRVSMHTTVILSILICTCKKYYANMHTTPPGASITVCLVYICHKCILPISETTSDSTDRIYELVEKKNPLVVLVGMGQ